MRGYHWAISNRSFLSSLSKRSKPMRRPSTLVSGTLKLQLTLNATCAPGLSGAGKSSLGGHNLAISKFAKNKGSALAFIQFLTSEPEEKLHLQKTSEAPVYSELYDDPELIKQFPYLPILKASVNDAVARPRVVKYGDATTAIQEDAYAALTGQKTTDDALKDMQDKLTSIIGK